MSVVHINKDNTFDKLITSTLDWQRLDSIYNSASIKTKHLIDQHGMHGVYQIVTTAEKTEELVSKNIGYIGSSRNIFDRVYCVKINKNHTAGAFIKRNDFSFDDIWIRFLFTDEKNYKDLESLLHSEMKKRYGYTFAWREASGGNEGNLTRIYEMIDKLSSRSEAENIYSYVRQRCIDLYVENIGSETEKE